MRLFNLCMGGYAQAVERMGGYVPDWRDSASSERNANFAWTGGWNQYSIIASQNCLVPAGGWIKICSMRGKPPPGSIAVNLHFSNLAGMCIRFLHQIQDFIFYRGRNILFLNEIIQGCTHIFQRYVPQDLY